ncbi:SPFH domain-containing protein [Corynebacterium epidermidicanis]|uniref:SPFH domain, Band 7 family protein n=1 Tax=Corynebacterium epidermidicanis TaxID=1050174 RepID=A0A0G3GWH2_9CORY|nr:SPFH domain-containing protein [Corynebacterium epidermidicanis]AKK03172.1 SPFH domain, Band 7 family protein [Corynebacterium epidermidicanis]
MIELAVLLIFLVLILLLVVKSIALIPQGEAAVIERLGKYTRTVSGGITILVPFIDRVRAKVDTRERVVSFPPQAVITQDNLTVAIDTVVTFQINDPARAIYGVDNYIVGVEQISTATLRDVVGGMTLEETLTSREVINRRLRGELDAATTKWGLRISRVELKAIDPPPSIQQSMEKQMKADREKRATILAAEGQREADIKTAEGEKQAKILAAEGEKHAAILAAEAERQAMILRAEGERAAKYLKAQGEARSIQKVNAAIKSAQLTPEVLAYQYLEKLPKMAEGSANKMWLVPSQFGDSLEQFARSMANKDEDGVFRYEPATVTEETKEMAAQENVDEWFNTESDPEIAAAVAAANAVANKPVEEDPGAALAAKTAAARDNSSDIPSLESPHASVPAQFPVPQFDQAPPTEPQQ